MTFLREVGGRRSPTQETDGYGSFTQGVVKMSALFDVVESIVSVGCSSCSDCCFAMRTSSSVSASRFSFSVSVEWKFFSQNRLWSVSLLCMVSVLFVVNLCASLSVGSH